MSNTRGVFARKIESALLRQWYPKAGDTNGIIYPVTYLLEKAHRAARVIHTAQKYKIRAGEPRPFKPFVIVVGNITVGGTGKTPLLLHLASELIDKGLTVAIISRGYAATESTHMHFPHRVRDADNSKTVGDEPLLIFQKLNNNAVNSKTEKVPVVIGPKRKACVALLCQDNPPDIILSDDGLQHYALPRDFEICVVDGQRGFGNTRLLPLGPLREPISALSDVDAIVINGQPSPELHMQLKPYQQTVVPMQVVASSVNSLNTRCHGSIGDIESLLRHYKTITAIAAIGNPQRFFDQLRQQAEQNRRAGAESAQVTTHAFSDHYQYNIDDLSKLVGASNNVESALLMTEKDAVKCRDFIEQLPIAVYAVSVTTDIHNNLLHTIMQRFNDHRISL